MRGQQPALAGQAHQRLLQLLERADLDLADALAADVIDLAELLERLGLVGEAPLGQDMALALVQASIASTSRSWRTRLSSASATRSSCSGSVSTRKSCHCPRCPRAAAR